MKNKIIEFRAATEGDEDFVNQLTYQVMKPYVDQTWDAERDRKAYYHKNQFTFDNTRIIQYDGVDVGRVTVTRFPNYIHVDEIHLQPEYQGKGIGSQVMEQILMEAKKEGVSVKLHLLRVNPAKKLYERLGFRIVRENKTHYFMEAKP